LLHDKPANNFGIAFLLSVCMALLTGLVVLYMGKFESFQFINSHHTPLLDIFFKYVTYYGDGVMWVPLVLYCVFFRKKYLIAVVAGILISTLLAQLLKRAVFPDELRPITYLADNFPVHTVEGVAMKRLHSFPSGHTTTAFTMALILAHIVNKKKWSVIFPLLAFIAGYSRVYLAQHFVTDVLAGMVSGIISGIISLLIYREIFKRKTSAGTG
jgi:membrane-associated phospholipid phosphatase